MTLARRGAALLYARGARRVWVFGSLPAGGSQDQWSDIDLAVEGLRLNPRAMAARLTHQLGSPVDLVAVDSTRADLRAGILRGGVLLPPGTDAGSEPMPAPPRTLYQHRLVAVQSALRDSGAGSVIDLGCGAGWLIELLARDERFSRITGIDMADDVLRATATRVRSALDPVQRARVQLTHGLLTHRDPTLLGHDAAVAMEIIEHLREPQRLAFEDALFGYARPGTIVVTTPNIEYNALFPSTRADGLRCADHRFEWTRREFATWCDRRARRYGYGWSVHPVGPVDRSVGAPTQMAIFDRFGRAAATADGSGRTAARR